MKFPLTETGVLNMQKIDILNMFETGEKERKHA